MKRIQGIEMSDDDPVARADDEEGPAECARTASSIFELFLMLWNWLF